jgi:GntR family transcriptional repressor for pyruvate dehydrogenase complex
MGDEPTIKRQPALAQQVADFLKKEIEKGAFKPGDPFPTEAALANRLEVSRTVVREAIARLKNEGLLESQKSGRTKLAKDPKGLLFRFEVGDQHKEIFLEQLYELRAIIEPEAAALAAFRATPEQMQTIKERLHGIKQALANGGSGTEESLAFHKAVIDASGNPFLAQFVSWVDKKLWSFSRTEDPDQNGETLYPVHEEHEAIIQAIEERNANRAREIARNHVFKAAKRHGLHINI